MIEYRYMSVCDKCQYFTTYRYACLAPCPECGGHVREGAAVYRRTYTFEPHPFFLFRWLGKRIRRDSPWEYHLRA